MSIEGVYSVDPGDDYHNRVPDIEVHVDSASVPSAKKKIPPSVDGIPVVVVPGKMPEGGVSAGHWSNDPAEAARLNHTQEEREQARAKYEPAFTQMMQDYGNRWNDLPGVIGMGAKCDGDNGCDYTTAEVTVQSELLPEVQREIPSSQYGVKILLVPEK